MGASKLKAQIVRLQREIERLSAQHAEEMSKRRSSASAKTRLLDAKRAEMLKRRLRQLEGTLKKLRDNQSVQ